MYEYVRMIKCTLYLCMPISQCRYITISFEWLAQTSTLPVCQNTIEALGQAGCPVWNADLSVMFVKLSVCLSPVEVSVVWVCIRACIEYCKLTRYQTCPIGCRIYFSSSVLVSCLPCNEWTKARQGNRLVIDPPARTRPPAPPPLHTPTYPHTLHSHMPNPQPSPSDCFPHPHTHTHLHGWTSNTISHTDMHPGSIVLTLANKRPRIPQPAGLSSKYRWAHALSLFMLTKRVVRIWDLAFWKHYKCTIDWGWWPQLIT